jgi:PAS domain S-box-containing protein
MEEWTERYRLYNHDGSRAGAEDLPLARALRGDDVRDVELESRPQEGGRRRVRVSGGPVRDAHGDIQGAALVVHDITEGVADEARLRLQSEVAANLGDSVAVVRAVDGEIVYVNESWGRMFGYERDELIGQPISVITVATERPPEERAREIIGALEHEGVWCGDVHSVRKDGTWFWCAATISTFEHPDHGSVWVVVQADTTEQRAIENALRAAEERFRSAFEQSPVAIALVGTDQRLTDVNHAFCDIVGHRPDELVGRPLATITHPDDLEHDAELAGKVLNGDLPRYPVEKRYLSKRGDVVPVAVKASMVQGPDGRPLYGITVVQEVAKPSRS